MVEIKPSISIEPTITRMQVASRVSRRVKPFFDLILENLFMSDLLRIPYS
jgi:hypothetical protein